MTFLSVFVACRIDVLAFFGVVLTAPFALVFLLNLFGPPSRAVLLGIPCGIQHVSCNCRVLSYTSVLVLVCFVLGQLFQPREPVHSSSLFVQDGKVGNKGIVKSVEKLENYDC